MNDLSCLLLWISIVLQQNLNKFFEIFSEYRHYTVHIDIKLESLIIVIKMSRQFMLYNGPHIVARFKIISYSSMLWIFCCPEPLLSEVTEVSNYNSIIWYFKFQTAIHIMRTSFSCMVANEWKSNTERNT